MTSVLEASSPGLTSVTFVTGYTARALPCHTADPELFFSEEATDMAIAKSLCASCPLIASCLEGALARAEPWGIWGGELFDNGKVVAAKRRAGRPRIRTQDEIQKFSIVEACSAQAESGPILQLEYEELVRAS